MEHKIKCLYCEREKNVRSDVVKTQKYCSISCFSKHRYELNGREKHPSWKGGRRITSQGYVEVRKPDHPRSRKNGYVFEHILVMESVLGRSLLKSEEVHHKDENKTNNDPENLEVLTKSDHAKKTGKNRKMKNMHPCIVCGDKVYRKPSQVERSKGKVFCGRSCLGKWTKENKKGVFKNVK